MVDRFSDDHIASHFAMRGGTALHKLFYELDPKGWGTEKMLAFEGKFRPKAAASPCPP